jgi:hypothetical protein
MSTVLACFSLLAALAFAPDDDAGDRSPGASAVDEDVTVVFQKKTILEISTVEIQGTVVGPRGTRIVSQPRARKGRSLMELRRNFRDALVDSADRL